MTNDIIPHWSVDTIFPSLHSKEYDQSIDKLKGLINGCKTNIEELQKATSSNTSEIPVKCSTILKGLNEIFEFGGMMRAFLHSYITTDSRNELAIKKNSEFERLFLDVQNLHLNFQIWVGQQSDQTIDLIVNTDKYCFEHEFALRNLKTQSKFLMSSDLEELGNELSLSGTSAWNKLQGSITSQLSVDFELDGKTEKLPMPALINLRTHPLEDVRKRAYDVEMNAWQTVEVPLAAALNGIKGATLTIEKRRGREDCLHSAIDSARIERKTLDVMIASMKDSLPQFHSYFEHKAKRIGKNQLDWWDLFAPDSSAAKTYTWNETKDFILTHFHSFSPDLSAFAKRAFDEKWIDAEQRDGKQGGAFCMGVPLKKESRILCNFDGTLEQIGTIAHELGHAFHNECAYKANKTEFQQDTPMTLAETASIMCETIVTEALLRETKEKDDILLILGNSLIGSGQVIVDIYSRFLFEKELFEQREKFELSPAEISDIMERAQKEAYGQSINNAHLNKYAWTWKPHYYSSSSFYNFPYSFGLLFAKGLYSIYQDRGTAFIEDYTNLLSSTGESSAETLAKRFNIDIQDRTFWDGSLSIIHKEIDLYKSL